MLENSKFEANLGNKADYRVLSYKMGKDVCCIQPKDKHPPDNGNLTYLVSMSADSAARLTPTHKTTSVRY